MPPFAIPGDGSREQDSCPQSTNRFRMRRPLALAAAAAVALGVLPAVGGLVRGSASVAPRTASSLPDGGPRALYRDEPALPSPHGWPSAFGDAFTRTSGTSRAARGGIWWTDFLYDDHGALGTVMSQPVAGALPARGTYTYPDGPAAHDGADVFRAAVAVDSTSTWWRVDWVTLKDARTPIAAWGIDVDHSTSTGASDWGAGTGVRSPGVDAVLVVSSRGASVVDPKTGARRPVPAGDVSVDPVARSFVVRVPRSTLPVSGVSRVRLVAGLADAGGTAFAPVDASHGALPGQPAVYNVAFRGVAQEPAGNFNFWSDSAQAFALANGDVSSFYLDVPWDALARRVSTPEPVVHGWSNRWYVSSIELGQGVVPDAGSTGGDVRPNFLGRVQPYGVYVPATYDGSRPVPLTWLLHSLVMNHNQYGSLSPKLLQAACEQRGSICATTLGRGPDGWYHDEAELDFLEVWHALGTSYRLDPERTALSGYSMGGYGTYKLGLEYPQLFASAVALAGPPACGIKLGDQVFTQDFGGRCGTDGDTTPLVGNARWVPWAMMSGVADQLVPVTSVLAQTDQFARLGLRYRLELYAQDHVAWAVVDDYSTAASLMGSAPRVRDPGRVDFAWYPHQVRADLGTGPTSAYWLSGLAARDAHPGALASVRAVSGARPDPAVTPVPTAGVVAGGSPAAGAYRQQTWTLGPAPARTPTLDLDLRNVASLTVDAAAAGFRPGERITVHVVTDGPVTVGVSGHTLTFAAGESRIAL
jgi:dienelactone hydrolase